MTDTPHPLLTGQGDGAAPTGAPAHCWIDPTDPPIVRGPYAPIIGPGRYHMKPGHTYRCRVCGAIVTPEERKGPEQ